MGTVIDHAIAIPALQGIVWQQLSAIQNNPMWQVDSERIAFLTTNHNGRNARWRSTMANGKECVIEITAWYEGLGYEYVIVDGVPYQENRGRIRLQEVAEGTVVQWTFNYEMSGALSGLRNSLGVRRQIDADIVDSLRNLYSYIKSLSGEDTVDPSDVKSIMRDAPDVEERAQYVPRHPTTIDDRPSVGAMSPAADTSPPMSDSIFQPPAAAQPSLVIPEPPVADDDTQPNPRIQTGTIPPVPDMPLQSFDDDVFAPPQKRDSFEFPSPFVEQEDVELFPFDDEPIAPAASVAQTIDDPVVSTPFVPERQPETPQEDLSLFEIAQRSLEAEAPSAQDSIVSEPPAARLEPSEPIIPAQLDPVEKPSELRKTDELAIPSPSSALVQTQELPVPPEVREAKPTDTARISVFEVFGLQKPSETQEMSRVDLEAAQALEAKLDAEDNTAAFFKSQAPIVPDIEPISGRVGLRARQRQYRARVRRPE